MLQQRRIIGWMVWTSASSA